MLGNTTYQPHTETIARIHGIRNTTPGAIATCAILVCSGSHLLTALLFLLTVLLQARWALSSDVSLQEVGGSTGIRYFQDYEEYFAMLETGLRRRKKTILNIFKEWDAKIFPETDSGLAGPRSNKNDTTSRYKVLTETLEDDDTDEEGDIESANN